MDPIVGTQIGQYRVGRPVGAGGIGSVFEATHQQIGRRVAIKVLRAEHARNQETVTRLFNEARAVNRVEHPGLVQIFDCDYLPDGRAYLVMEFLQGETLTQRLTASGGRFGIATALRIAYQLASILAATHSASIVHRDLKPGNIMLVRDPDMQAGERVKLLDFGIAKLAPEAGSDGLTRPGMVFGTPTYMSPEQCRGSSDVDGRSDVYSLAVILYQMLAGKPPFPGEGVGVVAMHLCEDPPPIESLVPGLDPATAALVGSMLAKKREDRPSMEQVAVTLKQQSATGSASYPSISQSAIARATATTAPMAGLSGDQSGSLSHPSMLGRMVGQQVEQKPSGSLLWTLILGGLLLTVSGVATVWLLRPPKPAPMQRTPAPPNKAEASAPADPSPTASSPTEAAPPSAGTGRQRTTPDKASEGRSKNSGSGKTPRTPKTPSSPTSPEPTAPSRIQMLDD
ncbi:MAG TPA: protein kinase [Pseudomonadota bacterium]|nr:protein kinase [Pseudomonadota bacterium]